MDGHPYVCTFRRHTYNMVDCSTSLYMHFKVHPWHTRFAKYILRVIINVEGSRCLENLFRTKHTWHLLEGDESMKFPCCSFQSVIFQTASCRSNPPLFHTTNSSTLLLPLISQRLVSDNPALTSQPKHFHRRTPFLLDISRLPCMTTPPSCPRIRTLIFRYLVPIPTT